ncbi:hypothetical protein GOP47_0013701 [Adiantum capillus-veneris]|uniref:Uncharacterized protein n=1 Tax=Adiantum capillus-veneris TaxID=13818 RepID=A0A9D4UP93_ADICA|nr:hypothetical protein GOP47_0013701 [Adiantum capillus-veneris]
MSKKKSSTMTLRDFHGGNIPSDLPLPSAPGMVVERKNHERPGSGGWMGSSLHRGYSGDRVGFSRQGSGNFARSYEEKISYLPNPANIGRNYDEDERKPVDGHNRRGQSSDFYEEPIYEQRQAGHERLPERFTLENRAAYTSSKHVDMRERLPQEESSPAPVGISTFRTDGSSGRPHMYQQDSPAQLFVTQDHAVHYSSQHVPPHSPYHTQEPLQPWRQNSLSQQPVTPGTVMGSGTGVQNVWTARRDGDYGRTYLTEYGVSDGGTFQTPAPRIAQASALEKVSSGKWNSRILQPSNETQIHVADYSQSYGGPYEGGSAYSPHDSSRFPTEYDRTVYADRAGYIESGRGIDTLSVRDTRLSVDKGNPQDTRREQYLEGRGGIQSDLNRYMDDRHAYGEIGQKGVTGQREPARFVGPRDGALPESGHSRLTGNRFNTNEAVPYSEARSTVQSNTGWVRLEPSLRREYGEGSPIDASKGLSSEFERRGLSGYDVVIDKDYGLPQRSYGSEHQIERGLHVDGPYHVSGQEDIGYMNSPYFNSRDDFSQEVSESARGGRFHDRSRVSEVDQSHPGRLLSPGSVRPPTLDIVGSANLSVEDGKGNLVERPKLKLLPRTKPVQADPLEESVQEVSYEGFEDVQSTGLSRIEGAAGSGSVTAASVINEGVEEPVRIIERPKLSLKPRSQPVEFVPAGSGSVKERMSVFGGARPRELVLKERGVDESVIVGTDVTPSSAPSPISSVRTPIEGNRTSSGSLGYGTEKQEKLDERSRRADQHETRMGRQDSGRLERLDSRGRRELADFEKKDERRGSEHRHHQEKRESDRPDVDKQESWRRPVEVPQSPVPVGEISSGGGGRPIQSAAELAQAFSRSTSFGSSTPGYASQRSPGPRTPGPGFGMGPETPGVRKVDVPFSRLTEAVSPGPRDFHVSGVQAGYRRTSAF